MVRCGKFKHLLNLALKKLYDIFYLTIQLGKGWILNIGQNNVNVIHTWIPTESVHVSFTSIPCFMTVPIYQVNGL